MLVRNFGDRPWQKCLLGPTHSPYKESVATEITFTLPHIEKGKRVYFVCEGTSGEDSAAIEVNGAYSGGFIGVPHRLEITKSVKEGLNTLRTKPFHIKSPGVIVVD